MLRPLTISLLVLLAVTVGNTQSLSPRQVVVQFFQAMYDADTSAMSELMYPSAALTSTGIKDGKPQLRQNTGVDFLQSVATADLGDLDEQISDIQITTDGNLASASMQYSFYYKGKLSHCGINIFTLVHDGSQWLITDIADTRRKSDCQPHTTHTEVADMIDAWHLAAAEADSAAYFGLMTHDAIFVGTDATEVWTKKQFLAFAAPYFAKGKAWAFTKVKRNIYCHDSNQLAWFDELLDTWMGPCRGSGVAMLTPAGWKIQHYVLSVTVPNDDIEEFMKIGQAKPAAKE